MIPWWATDFGEDDIAAVTAAIRDKHISQGPVTRRFEERLADTLGVPHVVCASSGTTALTMALLALGVRAGYEVVVPNRTWIATAHAVMMTGAAVKLADVDSRGLLHVEQLSAVLSKRTGAVIPVNLNGRYSDVTAQMSVMDMDNVIEDSCQGFPKPPEGVMSCYSFSMSKLVSTGQGGCIATHSEDLYRELLSLRTHDVENAMVPKVLEWKRFGYNFRYTDLQASIGLVQLAKMKERIDRLWRIRHLYFELPEWLELLPCDGVPLYTEVLYEDSECLRIHLLEHGIQARPNYPSLDSAPYLHAAGEFPNSRRFEHGLTLPSGPAQKDADIKRVIECLHDFK